jgi:hypothetical protein
MKNCRDCKSEFLVDDYDLEFLKKFDVPAPTLCPDCRQRRRICYRNERSFYKRKCDLTGESIISIYPQDFKGKVYAQDAWWSDDWDPKEYGRDFDFSRGFFEQYLELSLDCPRICVVNMSSENSTYTNHAAYNKSCYMCMNTGWGEELIYCSNYCLYNKNCVDCLAIQKCELCYFCVNVKNSFNSNYLYECENCNDCEFGFDLKGCNNCFGCWNLRHKEFCIYNKQYSKDEYQAKVAEMKPRTWEKYMAFSREFSDRLNEEAIFRGAFMESCQECTGDHVWDSKNVKDSFYIFGSEDCRYCYDAGEMKNVMDVVEPFKGELQYEIHACNMCYDIQFCSKCYENNNMQYCQYCWNSENLFGCFGMKRQKFCILNKQYEEAEYKEMISQIVEYMKETGEWGEFFPKKLSPFAYNETIANEYYPRKREEILAEGLKWNDEEDRKYEGEGYEPVEDIFELKDDIVEKVLVCELTGRPFKIVKTELDFYRRKGLPIPHRHPDRRHMDRMGFRSARKLWERKCVKTGEEILSVYREEEGPKNVYSQKAYLGEVY